MSNLKQIALLEQDNMVCKKSWFAHALDVLGISETPGWPDAFGNALIKWNSDCTRTPIKVLSLFSGAGGLDIGFHDAGFKIVECNEIEKAFAATLIENSKDNSRLEGASIKCLDINKYDPALKDIDFVIGGPPCQTFSAAGARAAGVNGTDDQRGNLFKQYARILKKLHPRGFLFENVYRIVGAQEGKPWEEIKKAFQDIGYTLYWRILDVADYGVPQFRERLIIVGLKNGAFKFPYPSHGPDSLDKREHYSAGKAITGVTSMASGSSIRGRHGHLLNDIPPGLNYSFYTEKLGHPKPIFGWRSKFSDYLYKADPDTPVRTIKAQGGQYTGPFHWDNRMFTIEELKRLQTFPDDYSVLGNRQKIIHQLGNSVPPQFARILALSILQQVFNQKLAFYVKLMPDTYKLSFRKRKRSLTKVYAEKATYAISRLPKNILKAKYDGEGKIFAKLTDDLQLLTVPKSDSADFVLEHCVQKGSFTLNLLERESTNLIKYELSVFQSRLCEYDSIIKSITLRSFSRNQKSVLGLWKYLEQIIKEYAHKDDLVQLFGYYQSKKLYTVDIKVFDSSLSENFFWKVLVQISKGCNIGKMMRIDELSYNYGVSSENLIIALKELKTLGFEIRNHNTNKQISEGMILIPYSFPSLNERSLQRLTEL